VLDRIENLQKHEIVSHRSQMYGRLSLIVLLESERRHLLEYHISYFNLLMQACQVQQSVALPRVLFSKIYVISICLNKISCHLCLSIL
jgi:hypothetical protein